MLEDRLQARFPMWFRGHRRHVAAPLLRGVRRLTRLDAVDEFLKRHPEATALGFVSAALDHLGTRYTIGGVGLDAVPERGPVVIVANHPAGALDALALLDAIGRVRPDVRIVANAFLSSLESLRPMLLPVDVFARQAEMAGVRAIDRALARGECVVMFPAGEVARLGFRGLREGRWRDGFVRLARRRGATVVPVRVGARNSAVFYGTSALIKPAATWLLAREMFGRRGQSIQLAFGAGVRLGDDAPREVAAQLRRKVASLRMAAPLLAPPRDVAPLAPPVERDVLRAGIASLELLGRTFDGMEIRVGRLQTEHAVMREIGRERERTFRAVGEGTGRALDSDAFDPTYRQIVLWDAEGGRIAGGYRIADVAERLAAKGLTGLYTSTLFRFDTGAVARLAAGVELGRSFVVPEYWGSRSIDYLWQGIGAQLRRMPWVRYVFGPVSISSALPEAARRDVVGFYKHWHGASDGVEALRPFDSGNAVPHCARLHDDFLALRARLATTGSSVPMLYRQYTELCEPGGARFLAFSVDPAFSDVVDGLVEVDLTRLRPQKRQRYLLARRGLACTSATSPSKSSQAA